MEVSQLLSHSIPYADPCDVPVLPETVSAIASADYADGLPTLNEVVSVLSSHGVEVVSKKLDVSLVHPWYAA